MSYAIEINVDVCDLATEDEADEVRAVIEDALAAWKPTVTATVREY
ncbi:hypothetical protein [Streptomyces prunicolor]